MDADILRLLQADLESQAAEIERSYAKVHLRTRGYETSEERRESLGFQLHNLYCALEDLFQMIAEAFENQIGDGGGWHVELLARMRREIPGVRPRVVTDEDYDALKELRGFRHVFRHAYAVDLNPEKLRIVLDQALKMEARVRPLVDQFVAACRGISG